jgi:hypothetical protein
MYCLKLIIYPAYFFTSVAIFANCNIGPFLDTPQLSIDQKIQNMTFDEKIEMLSEFRSIEGDRKFAKRIFPNNELPKPSLERKLKIFSSIKEKGRRVFNDQKSNLSVYVIDGRKFQKEVNDKTYGIIYDPILQELGRLRQSAYRSVDEGNDNPIDIDAFDYHYLHFVAVDNETGAIVGAYRVGNINSIISRLGIKGVYTHEFFENEAILREIQSIALELGRSFVDKEAGRKALRALDALWKGVTEYIADRPQTRYLLGSVSISNAYSEVSKILMLGYLSRHQSVRWKNAIKGRAAIAFNMVHNQAEIFKLGESLKDTKELNLIVNKLDQTNIPSLLISYEKMNAKYLAFTFDAEFGSIDGFIVVDLMDPRARDEVVKHFRERWNKYFQFQLINNNNKDNKDKEEN